MLDSHVLLWYDDATKLKRNLRHAIDTADQVHVSVVTVWELTSKQNLGKLFLRRRVVELADNAGFDLLAIDAAHAQLAGSLPLHHRDPFDRMLVAQAMLEGLTLVTHDATLRQYGVPLLQV